MISLKPVLCSNAPNHPSSRDLMYEHLYSIEKNARTGAKFKVGDDVYIGETIARLGDANGFYVNAAHLHFEMRRDTSVSVTTNPYYQPLPVSTALRYSSPSLFIDDRSTAVVQNLVNGQWTYFYQSTNAPSSTAFIEYNSERHSLKKAADRALIYSLIYEQQNGSWSSYGNITDVFFKAGYTYAVYSYVPGAKLNILIPGDRYRADRAKIDMLHAAATDSRFTDIKDETYQENLSWELNWELRQMDFGFSNSPGRVTMYQITLKTNPLVRATGFSNPANSQWSGWIFVNQNRLD